MKISLRYVGKESARENLSCVSNNWLTQDEKEIAVAISKSGSDEECENELARLESICNQRYRNWYSYI